MITEPTHVLLLNDMRSSKYEYLTEVCIGTIDELEALLERERVESYTDEGWGKSYRKGGPLEWYNRPNAGGEHIVKRVVPVRASELPQARIVSPHERIDAQHISAAIRTTGEEFVICCNPFRWMRGGEVIPNAYEMHSLEQVCEDNHWQVVCLFGDHIAVVKTRA